VCCLLFSANGATDREVDDGSLGEGVSAVFAAAISVLDRRVDSFRIVMLAVSDSAVIGDTAPKFVRCGIDKWLLLMLADVYQSTRILGAPTTPFGPSSFNQ